MVKIYKINIVYLSFIFIWFAVRLNILEGIDGAGRLETGISVFIFVLNLIYNKSFLSTFSIKIWFLWFIYASINTIMLFDEDFNDLKIIVFIGRFLLVPMVVMSVVSSFKSRHIYIFLRFMEYVLYFVMIVFFFTSEVNEGRIFSHMFDVNELVLFTIALVASILINSILTNRKIYQVILVLLFPTYYIIMAGSRMGFACYLLLIMGYWVSTRSQNIVKSTIQLIIIVSITFMIVESVLENTILGQRLNSTTTQSETQIDRAAMGTVFEKFGDRGAFYVRGWNIFNKNVFFGIGLLNYKKNSNYVLHIEYIIHLAELGIIGFFLYISFLFSLLLGLFKSCFDIYKRKEGVFLFFVFLSILFAASVLFLYKSLAIAYLFGLIVLLSKKEYSEIKMIK